MACAQQSATEYLRNARRNLVTDIKNFPLIIENLYQQNVFNDHEVDALKAERTEFDKARCVLDWVINKGEMASYEFLKILDVTKKRTLDPVLHYWISCFSFRVEDTEATYSFGTKPCQIYQAQLKMKAKSILKNQRECFRKYLDDKAQVNFSFIPLVLKTDSVMKTQCKIKLKNKKCKKLRPKKLRAYIPNVEQALPPDDLLKWQDKNILIIGKPGVGKTTVVQEMLHLWSEKDDRELDYMFYFDESVLAHSSSAANLKSILFDVYLKPMDKDKTDVFQDIEENSENVVIVFDGVTDLEENSIFWKIMNHELLPDAKIVITCRSEVEDDPLFSIWPTRKVYVQGFSEESINTYYQSMLGHDPLLLGIILKNPELFSLSHVPLYAFMIVDLIKFKNDTECTHPHTVTEMYIHIFRLAVKKHGNKKNKHIDKYLKEIKDQVHPLMENAFNATMRKRLNLSDISSDETDICHAFLKMITTKDSPTSATTYCAFLHNTMQEFFSALWLLHYPDEIDEVLQLCQTEEHKHMRHVLPFLCGFLSKHNIRLLNCLFPEDQIKKTSDWLIEKHLDTFLQPQSDSEEFDLLYVCQCLYELQSPKACLMFLEKMDHQLEPEVDLDPHQCCALSYVISQSRDKEVYLNLEDCNVIDVGMNMMLSCSPNIRLKTCEEPLKQIKFFLEFFHKTSQCCCRFFDDRERYNTEQCNALLDLYSHVKNYETQTGRSFLPALQSVFQSAPDVWIIDLSQRKTSILLEVLKLQTEKKLVELRGCSEEESEMMSFLQCLPFVSQMRFRFTDDNKTRMSARKLLLNLYIAAVENDTDTGTRFSTLLSSVCSYETFPFPDWDDYNADQSDFLLDLYSHVKNYETQTGRSFLPALQSVFQLPDDWSIDLSQRKSSILLEMLKLQTEKKPVDLRECSEEESEIMSFLQCLPYISQLGFWSIDENETRMSAVTFLLNLCVAAVDNDTNTGTRFSTLLSSVCSYETFPFPEWDDYNAVDKSDFLLDLYSHVKNYETQAGRSFVPALQSVFQSAPDVWAIFLSEIKTSILLEVLKLQTEKKPVDLLDCPEEESDVMSFLHCLPYISQLRFWSIDENETRMSAVKFLLNLCVAAVENDTNTGTRFSTLLSSVCSYEIFPFAEGDQYYTGVQSDFLLDLYSHVKNYETQTGRSFLPALQSVFQLPDVWIIDLSQRKSSVLLEMLKLQTEKKPVELRGCSEEESEIMSFLQCLSYISQLGFWFIDENETRMSAVKFLLNLCVAAVENDTNTGTRFSNLLSSVCSYETFPFPEWDDDYNFVDKSAFLLDLCLHVKNYETQAGRSFVPALQSVFQSAPDVWAIFLSEIKTSILLEVLKLQTEKKPVDLLDCPEEESDVMSFLHCLPYISQLRFWFIDEKETRMFAVKLLLNLYIAAVENDTDTGTRFLTLLSSVCSYETFPFPGWVDYNAVDQSDFLLGLYSHVKNYETQTGRSFLPALQSVFQLPDVWIIDLSERESSILQEVLKLQTEKKPVELRGCSEEESEMMSFLQCMPYISQLSCSERCLLTLVKVVQFRENPELVTLLLEVTGFSVCLEDLSSKTCESVGGVLHFLSDRLNLTLKPKVISVRETRLLFRHITNIHTLRLSGYMVVRIVQALRSMRVQTPITVNELKLDLKLEQWSETKLSRVLSSLAILLRLWTVQCLNLTEYKIQSVSVFVLLCHQGPLTLRPSKETLQKLVECVYEAQEEELTQCLLQKVGGDLTSCSLNWEELHYFLQHRIQQITLNLRKSNIKCSIREILPFLNRIKFKWMSSSFMLSIIREIYESGSVGFVSSLLSSVENYINLQSRELDSVHCAALRFTLQHCTAVSLNLQWTSIPEEELESILPLFKHVSHLSVDRLLLLKMLHCCSVSDVQQEAAAVLLSILQHKLDFSCCSALDLTTNTDSEPLHLTTEDCRVTSRVIQRAHSDTKTQLILQDCEITTAGMNQLFPVLHSLQLCCDKSLLLQFLAHVRCEEAESLSQALGEDLNLSQTQLDLQVCRGLKLILEYSEGLTELDLSQCRLTDDSLDLLLPNLHKAQNIDFSDNSITDAGAQKIYSVVTHNSNIKTVRLFNNRIESKGLFLKNPLFEIW